MQPIIYLNGTSSAGKSSIAAILQERLGGLYLHVMLDVFLQMVPPGGWQRPGGAVMTPPRDGRGLDVEFGPLCQPLFTGFHRSLAALAGAGNRLIVDDVLVERRWLDEALAALAPFRVCFVGVYCPVDVAEARERARGNRAIGTARGQIDHVHAHATYDVDVDTSWMSAEECAERIIAVSQQLPNPTAFERLRAARA